MFLVIGSHNDYDPFEPHIFGYSFSKTNCEKLIEDLKKKQLEFRNYHTDISNIHCDFLTPPPQEKYEKLKDYDKRIKPIQEANEKTSQEYWAKRKLLSDAVEDFDKYNDLSGFPYYDFEIKEIEEMETANA